MGRFQGQSELAATAWSVNALMFFALLRMLVTCVYVSCSIKRRPSDEKLPDVQEIKSALDVDGQDRVAELPKLPLPDEERERISSVYSSHDFEAEPPNM